MKKIITLLFVAVAAMSLSTASFAQAAGPAGGTPKIEDPQKGKPGKGAAAGRKLMAAIRGLGLSKEQMTKVRDLSKKMQDANKELQQQITDGKLKRKEAAPKLLENLEAFKTGLKDVLTPEQFEKLQKEIAADTSKTKPENKKKKGDGTL